MWWQDFLWGLWNGLTAWIVLIVHVFGSWERFPFYDMARSGNWYDFGFLPAGGRFAIPGDVQRATPLG
jgi:hypothetical protein